ncbi:MAG: S8 family serine peptidase, partial [Planctomycetota bacterium]
PLVELTRTIGISATGRGCLAVASHVSSRDWESDAGAQVDNNVLVDRISPFSSQGPTRDGRQKPEISAPGQYLTAGLAESSELASVDERADTTKRLLSIEGTSMSAPIATGAIALMLQKRPTLTTLAAERALAESAIVDGHTSSVWNPSYGHGKLDLSGALNEV